MGITDTARDFWKEVRHGTPSEVYALIARQVYREWYAYGLRREINCSQTPPTAKIPLAIRELRDEDIPLLFGAGSSPASRRTRLEVEQRRAFLAERVPTPYVAVDLRCDRPCFLQWLMTAKSNERIQRYFRGRFPLLRSDEALLEYAYTPPEYRGNGIMPAAMAIIAENASLLGCSSVLTFVLRENSNALRACAKAGFVPFAVRRDRHYAFHLIRTRKFSDICSGEQELSSGGGTPQS